MMLMFFADLQVEAGPALDWACSRAAAEQLPVGTWLAQVLKLYQTDLLAQEQSARIIAHRERKFERIKNS